VLARPRVQAYLAAAVAVVVAIVVRLILHAWVSEGLPFLPFFIAVVAASAYGGFGPGVLAAALSTLAASWIVPPEWLAVGDVSATGALMRFFVVGAVVAWLNDRLRRARTVQERAAARIAEQEESLRDADLAHRRLAAIVESSEDSILGLDMNGVITSWNRGAERLYGYTAAEAVGRPVTLVIPQGSMVPGGYDLEASQDLQSWTRLGPFEPGNVAAFYFDVPPETAREKRFYRSVYPSTGHP